MAMAFALVAATGRRTALHDVGAGLHCLSSASARYGCSAT